MVDKTKETIARFLKVVGFSTLVGAIGIAWVTKYKADQSVEENCAQEIRLRTCERDISALKVMVDRVVSMDRKLDEIKDAVNRKDSK